MNKKGWILTVCGLSLACWFAYMQLEPSELDALHVFIVIKKTEDLSDKSMPNIFFSYKRFCDDLEKIDKSNCPNQFCSCYENYINAIRVYGDKGDNACLFYLIKAEKALINSAKRYGQKFKGYWDK